MTALIIDWGKISTMNLTAKANISDHPFWRFSVKVWDQDSARSALQILERNYGLNPNIFLFCCWYASAGYGRLTREDILQLIAAISHWHDRVVLSLQRLGEKTKTLETIRQDIQTEIIVAIHIEQLMLAEALAQSTRNNRNINSKLTEACKNVALYIKMVQTPINPTTQEAIYQVIAVAFPTIDLMQTYDACKTTLLAENSPMKIGFSQPQLLLD